MSHTPGPWKVLDFATGNKGFIAVVDCSERAQHICDVFPFGQRPGGAKRELDGHLANARLIAAAPDLLAAAIKLDHMALVIDSAVRNANNGNYNKVLFALKAVAAAIAKAEGTSP